MSDTAPSGPLSMAILPGLQPYPDRLRDELTIADARADQAVVARETIELAFMAAVQLLPPRQRAVLILRDVVGWPAAETASALGLGVAAVNSALQRARATLRRHQPSRFEHSPGSEFADAERHLVRRFIEACERYDIEAMVALAREDIRMTVPSEARTWDGRAAYARETEEGFGPGADGVLRCLATRANRQPAVAAYMRRWDDANYRPFVLNVLRVEDGGLAELTTFGAEVFPVFALPPLLPDLPEINDRTR